VRIEEDELGDAIAQGDCLGPATQPDHVSGVKWTRRARGLARLNGQESGRGQRIEDTLSRDEGVRGAGALVSTRGVDGRDPLAQGLVAERLPEGVAVRRLGTIKRGDDSDEGSLGASNGAGLPAQGASRGSAAVNGRQPARQGRERAAREAIDGENRVIPCADSKPALLHGSLYSIPFSLEQGAPLDRDRGDA
jgi:hypothetical protein